MDLPVGVDLYQFGNEIQLYGAVFAGKGFHFIIPLPDEDPQPCMQVLLPLDHTGWETLLRQTDLQNVLVGPDKAIVRKSQRQIDSIISWSVYRRDNYTCRYCGNDKVPLTVDHVDLWEDGGITTEANLISACRRCNKLRGRMKYEDWLASKEYARVCERSPFTAENLKVLETLPALRAQRVPLSKVRSR